MPLYTGLKVEIEFVAGTWTDVTADVDQTQGIQIKYGRTSEFAAPSVGTCTFQIDNHLGIYTPLRQTALAADGVTVIAHPHYPNVLPRKRVRVSYMATSVQRMRFVGYIKSWPPSMENGFRGYVTITANDRLDQLSRIFARQGYLQTMLADSPSCLLPFSDNAGAPGSLDLVSGTVQTQFVAAGATGAAVETFGSATPPARQAEGLTSLATQQAAWTANLPATGVTSSFSIESWQTRVAHTGSAGVNITLQSPDLTAQAFIFDNLTGSASANAGFTYVDSANPASISATWPIGISDGLAHLYSLTVLDNGSNLVVSGYIDGVLKGSGTGARGGTGFGSKPLQFTSAFRQSDVINFGPASVYPVALSATRVAAHAAIGLGTSMTTGARVAEYLYWAGLQSADLNVDPGSATVSVHPTNAKTLLQLGQEMAVTEAGGSAFYTANDGRVRFCGRYFRLPSAPVLTIDADKDLDNSTYAPAFDDLTLINQSIGTRTDATGASTSRGAINAASESLYGVTTETFTSFADSDTDVLSVAQWRVAANGNPAFRFGQVAIDLIHTGSATDFYTALASAQIGSRIRVDALPSQAAPRPRVDCIVEGWSETITFSSYRVVFDTTPADNPYQATYDTARYAPDPGSITVQAALTSATFGTLSVTIAAGSPCFTQNAAAYPLLVKVNEEIISLPSAPASATSPQAWSGITRGAAGSQAAPQPVGSVVTTWPLATYTI